MRRHAHPFAEEMNKSRRMVALQASALADAGYAVLQLDLDGCGDDSSGFADASWEGWCSDVVRACRWMGSNSPDRSGCGDCGRASWSPQRPRGG